MERCRIPSRLRLMLARTFERSNSRRSVSTQPCQLLRRQCHVVVPCQDFNPFLRPKMLAISVGTKRPLSLSLPPPVTLDSWWKESTTALLDRQVHPVGSFDTLLWHKAETMILYWAGAEQSQDLDLCFRLLDRVVEEAAAAAHSKSQFRLHIYLIHAVLASWKEQFQKFESKILPSQMLARIEGYLSTAQGIFEPTVATYSIILDGASYCPDPAERIDFSEELLERLFTESVDRPELRPTDVTIGTILKAWSKSGSIQEAQRAENLMRRIIDLSKNDEQWHDLKVNTIHYTTVLQAYANAREPEHAQRLLREMFEESLANDNTGVHPNVWSFNTVLSAWSKSSAPDAFESAEEIFIKMGELYENGILEDPPGVITYNCLLNILANNAHRVPDCVEKAEALLTSLLEFSARNPSDACKPTLVTFIALFRILAASRHPDKAKKASYWFDKAKELGISDKERRLDRFTTKLLGGAEKPRMP